MIEHVVRLENFTPCPAELLLGTSESRGVECIRLVRGAGWDGLDITATYHPPGGAEPVRVPLLGSEDVLDVPAEATARGGRGALVVAGLGEGVCLPTCNIVYKVVQQAGVAGRDADEPTPDLVQKVLGAANEAKDIAQSVRDDADSGAFTGPQGPKGDTPELEVLSNLDIEEILKML